MRSSPSHALLLLCSVLSWAPGAAHAIEGFSESKRLYVGAGAIALNFLKTTRADTASPSPFGTIFPHLNLSGRIPLDFDEIFTLIPSISYTPLSGSSIDEAVTRRLLIAGINLAYGSAAFDFHMGTGVLFYMQSGNGGTVTQQNGTSTAVFAKPSYSSTTRNLYLSAGVGMPITELFRVDLDTIMMSLFSARRSFSLVLQVSAGIF